MGFQACVERDKRIKKKLYWKWNEVRVALREILHPATIIPYEKEMSQEFSAPK